MLNDPEAKASSMDVNSKIPKVDGSVASSGIVGGLTVILNILVQTVFEIPEDQIAYYITLSPVASVAIWYGVLFIWRAIGPDPEVIRNERKIKKAIKIAKKQLTDEHLGDVDKERVKQSYAELQHLLRNHGVIKLQETSNPR